MEKPLTTYSTDAPPVCRETPHPQNHPRVSSSFGSLTGLEAGLHAYLELRSDINASQVARLARERDVIVTTLDAYYIGTSDRSGLLLGYGSLDLPDIIQGAKVLREVIELVV